MTAQVELAVIGAGPAGIAAATTAARMGVDTVLVDAYLRPGGQYFKQPSPHLGAYPPARGAGMEGAEQRPGAAELRQLAESPARVLCDTLVWGAFPADGGEGWELALHGRAQPPRLLARALILATGAYDRPIPFPGWTLPGVMAAGGVQSFLKGQGALPGRRFVLSGTGPLQLAVAAGLVEAGAEVAGVFEASALHWRDVRYATALWGQWHRIAEGWRYLRTLRSARVPIRLGWAVVRAEGQGHVEKAVVCRLDRAGSPIAGAEQMLEADTIAIGYGLIPSTELTRLLGCTHEFRPESGGYVPVRAADMATSLPGVYAAGDGAGIGGAEMAQIEGRIAAAAAARYLGRMPAADGPGGARDPSAGELARQQRFARAMGRLFAPRPGLYGLARDDTIICRCEEVTLGDIRRAVADGATSVNEVKGLTRTGMGNCQGRVCGELVARILAMEVSGQSGAEAIAAAGQFTARPPIHPLPLAELARTAE